jgi:hypothetical protein
MPRQPAGVVSVWLAWDCWRREARSIRAASIRWSDAVSGVSETTASEWNAASRPRLCDAEVDRGPVGRGADQLVLVFGKRVDE